ncbi:MAG: cold shock domain-containing protein [Rhodanobacter sp.]
MRTHGTLVKWNADRGFGFIQPAVGNTEIFVHVSEFPRDGVRPRVGELVSYELEARKDGKAQATGIMRPGGAYQPRQPQTIARGGRRQSPFPGIGVALLLAGIAAYAYFSRPHAVPAAPEPAATLVASPTPRAQVFDCDGRTRCPQMTSCAEATYFLNNCPGTTMDGDGDGVPCESQWCAADRHDWP